MYKDPSFSFHFYNWFVLITFTLKILEVMARTKLKKIQEVASLENVFDYNGSSTEEDLINRFGNNNPISLEIGCGEGSYTIELAKLFPGRNFVGIDFKGARIYLGATKAIDENLSNAAFLWLNAERLPEFFKSIKIDEIFITFPEPHFKRRAEQRRLVSPKFLEIYRQILKPNGHVHLKTDSELLYNYAIEKLAAEKIKILFHSDDIYSEATLDNIQSIQTRFEKHYLKEGRKIKHVEFVL